MKMKEVGMGVDTWVGISGSRSAWVCGLVVYISLYGIGIAYTITSAISMRYAHSQYNFAVEDS